MAWRVHVCDTSGGAVLSELPFSALRWSDSLDFSRGTSLSVTVPLESAGRVIAARELDRIRSVAYGSWRHTLLAAWDDRAIVACPVVTHQVSEDQTEVAIGCVNPSELLAARTVIPPGAELVPTGTATKFGPTTLPTIALALLQHVVYGAPLPFELPDLPATGDHTRTYEAADLTHYAEALQQLSDVAGGPDVHLQAVLAADQQSFWWEARIGQPHLGVDRLWTWTLGSNCTGIGVDFDAAKQTNRAYAAGRAEPSAAGGAAASTTPIGVAQDLDLLDIGWPLLERADTATTATGTDDATTTGSLDARAAEYVRVNRLGVQALSVTVRAGSAPQLGVYAVGDTARLVHHGHRWLGDGVSTRRILAHSGDHTDVVRLTVADTPDA